MATPTKLNFKIYQGSTFEEVLRRESSTKAYAPITGITKSAPMVVTSVAHGIPLGWRAKITNVIGMKEVNSTETYHVVTDSTVNSVTFNNINSLSYTDYTSGGVLEYNTPVPMVGVTARMQIRSKIDSTEVIKELTTENGGVTIDPNLGTVTILISAADTALFDFSSAVYSMELINGTKVSPFITGSISLEKEITR